MLKELNYCDFINSDITSLLDGTISEIAYQLTAYEKYGIIDNEELKEYIIDEYKGVEIEINEYNEAVDGDNYIYENDDDFFEECFYSKSDAVRAVIFGNYSYNDDYVVFNGYGNLDSHYNLVDLEYYHDDILDGWIDNLLEINEEECQEIIDTCNKLIKEGY